MRYAFARRHLSGKQLTAIASTTGKELLLSWLIFPQPAGVRRARAEDEEGREKMFSRRTDKEAGKIIETAGGGNISVITGNNYLFPVSAGLSVQDCGDTLFLLNILAGRKEAVPT